jgi:hypothetical protein
MTAAEALRLAHEAGISVSLVGDFIRYQSYGAPPAHVLDALKAAKPEIVALLSRFRLDASGALAGDHVLYDLAELGFSVRLCGDQAALDDETSQGRVPPMPLLYRFAENQTDYELVLRALSEPDADQNGGGDRVHLKQRGAPPHRLKWRT